MPNVLSPRDLVSRPDIMDETVPHNYMDTVRVMCLLNDFFLDFLLILRFNCL